MEYQKTSWTGFKNFINSTNSKIYYIEESSFYDLFTSVDGLSITCNIKITDPKNSDQIDFEDNFKSLSNPNQNKPVKQSSFTAKEEDGKKLFTRTHGIEYNLQTGLNDCLYTITYNQVKFDGIEIIGCQKGDKLSLQILDSSSGIISTIPNFMLNQFGFNVGVPDNFYTRFSKYDADLIAGLQIKLIYSSISNKEITVNYILHELKQ